MKEEKSSKQSETKPKKTGTLIAIIILLIIIIVGMSIYIMYDKGILFSDTEVQNKNSNSEKDILEKEENKKLEEIRPLDLSKCLNTTNTYSNYTDIEGNVGLSTKINPDKKSITLSIDWSIFGPLTATEIYSPNVEEYQITGFTKEINQAFVGQLGQDAMGITLFYLMEDKTVEYMPMFTLKTDSQNNSRYEMNYTYEKAADGKITGTNFTTNGTLTEAKEVIKFYTITASNEFGWITTIGATKDGSFYDLGAMISK